MYDLENAPYGLILEVLDLRGFMRVKAQLDNAKDKKDGPRGPMATRVWAAWAAVEADRKEQRLGPNSG
jgi:hypothetical protein